MPRRARLLTRLDSTRQILDNIHARLAEASLRSVDIGPAGEWLLDNFHVVQEHVREVHQSLPRDYYRELPQLAAGPLAGYPRVYEIAITLISHTEGRIDLENVDLFVDAFQEVVVLSIGELWAIPAMLRLGLIESIRRMSLRTAERLDEVEAADRWIERIQDAHRRDPDAVGETLAEFVGSPPALTPIFVSRFVAGLRLAGGAFPPLIWLEQWLADEGISPDDAAVRSTQRLALTKLMMSNSITSLRGLGQRDWRAFVERQSAMEHALRAGDPSRFYKEMTFATRDAYRHAVERIAKRTRHSETDVVRRAVDLAQTESGGESADSRREHVGYYLVDRGVADLEAELGYTPTVSEAVHRWVLRHPTAVYVGALLAATVGAVLAALMLAGADARAVWPLVVLLTLLPAADIAVSLVNQLVTSFLPPRVLPRLDLSDHGVPAAYRTAIVVPTLFPGVDAVQEALDTLEIQFLANRDAHLHYAILSDFTDAPNASEPGDADILTAAAEGVQALNARYAAEEGDTFFLFHRPRRWNARQGVWMGWERKRGKLAEFNRFIRGEAPDAFSLVVGKTEVLRHVRYVITLDSDTLLPPEAAPALIGALAHPLNRARYDETQGRVVDGYGIIQPRVGVSVASAQRSRFAAIYSGHPGVDPYTTAVSDVYQDLFGEGSFTGKGIYDVDAFERATHGRFPENTLLSHDLIEGNYARAGLATDVSVFDEYPSSYLTFSRRKHRWVRGDWQLLQWLTPRVPGPDGPEPNRLSLLSRWKIFDNLRRSTVEISQLALLLAGWTILPGSPLRWTLLALGAIGAPWALSMLIAAVRPPGTRSWRAYYHALGEDAAVSLKQFALAVAFLPHQAWLSADAIVRTLWRMWVSRKRLLEWQAASLVERATTGTLARAWWAMWPALALAGAATVLIIAVQGWSLGLALALLPLLALWLASPAIAHRLAAPAIEAVVQLSESARARGLRYAEMHWQYFDQFVSEASHWLAPDNFQEDPVPVVAMRTSPTNIGLQLLSTVSAFDLGFIGVAEMVDRLERAVGTLARLERYRGHFYNWYELNQLTVLEPAYVSTVDSGNLAGHFIALRQACLTIARDGAANGTPELAARLEAIGDAAERYAMEMDFAFLFDTSRKLFTIGYHTATHTPDDSHYDLLASEARLASFVAIAKNDVPVEHWFRLGRTLTHVAGDTALVSWSGSMFEYLMPTLVMHAFQATVLGRTVRIALDRQVEYGAERSVPWGVSECAYNVRDRHLTYQYRAFGVPELGLKRGLGRDVVVAPYATALAAMLEPELATANLARLEELGALGRFGFVDALDYTRPAKDQRFALVRTFMAHHVGMTIVSLANALQAGTWQRRFHSDPMIRAIALLLDERVPRRIAVAERRDIEPHESLPVVEGARPVVRVIETPDTRQPHVAFLGQLPHTIMVSHAGGGYSRYEDLAITRWRSDGTLDNTGQFCYVRDVSRRHVWSVAHQPVGAAADWYRALLATDRVTLHRADGDIDTRTEIVVVPADSAEVRIVTVTNNGDATRDIELTSYGEIVMAPPAGDRLHPAFSNLFVETEWHDWCTAITAKRRPRSAEERELWCVHVVDAGKERVGKTSYETSRARFLGRGRTTRDPAALDYDGPLPGTTGAVLDPIFALRTRLRLERGQSASVAFTTLVATSRERAFELADRYHDPHAAQRALDLAWTTARIELQDLDTTPADAAVFQDLAGFLLFPSPVLRAPREELLRNRGSQAQLWGHGISGDWPIVLARIDEGAGIPTLQQTLAAHRYWRRRGLTIDLVIVVGESHSYHHDLNDRVTELVLSISGSAMAEGPGGIFVRRLEQLAPEELQMISATARLHITCDGRLLPRILAEVRTPPDADIDESQEEEPSLPRMAERSTPPSVSVVQRLRTTAATVMGIGRPATTAGTGVGRPSATSAKLAAESPTPPHLDATPLTLDNGYGGLTEDGAYRIHVHGDFVPPAPWANVIASPAAGCIVTERGAGVTWAGNSYFYRITPWHNDPVSDPPADVIYLRDEDTGEVWCPTPAPIRRNAPFVIDHRPGYSVFLHQYAGIESRLILGVAPEDPVRLSLLRLTNHEGRRRRLTVTSYVEWTLGVLREHTQHQVITAYDGQRSAIFARNHFNPQFTNWVAFSALSERVTSHTGDRREFLGRNGRLAEPAALRHAALAANTGPGLDPCAALQCVIDLSPGESRDIALVLGAAEDVERAQRLVDRYRVRTQAEHAITDAADGWSDRLSALVVRTPDPSFDTMLNQWALYQALSCRMWGRTAVYQSGGAFGFRDQLQDVMAFVYAEPAIAREHIVLAAGRQFEEGDVQHWWHPDSGRGVRTRFSDDLVWLPYVVDHYVTVTGDAGVLDEEAPFLRMRELKPDEHEVYELPEVTTERATVYEHCRLALVRASTAGPHGLPLIGTGDWNDGMNRVGMHGRGESVWLAWFLITALRSFADHAERRGDIATATEMRGRATSYAAAIEEHAWDGAWYRRAYFDDGTPLGSAANSECRIDSIAQTWSVISGAGDPQRQERAMRSLEEHLVDDDARILLLLTPPFDEMPNDPGYIKGYVPGVRENGAQYTHAALWVVLATALQGNGARAFELFQMINPLTRTGTPEGVQRYKVEPYVVAADIYATEHELGRGGWTWYTGSASWMYRVGLEAILGFRKQGNTLWIEPCVPPDWPELSIEYRCGRSLYSIRVESPEAVGRLGGEVTLDGDKLESAAIPLHDDGRRHEVVVRPLASRVAGRESQRG